MGLDVRRHVIRGALHTEIMSRPEGRTIAVEAIRAVGNTHTTTVVISRTETWIGVRFLAP
jgi:hypothetical protein